MLAPNLKENAYRCDFWSKKNSRFATMTLWWSRGGSIRSGGAKPAASRWLRCGPIAPLHLRVVCIRGCASRGSEDGYITHRKYTDSNIRRSNTHLQFSSKLSTIRLSKEYWRTLRLHRRGKFPFASINWYQILKYTCDILKSHICEYFN